METINSLSTTGAFVVEEGGGDIFSDDVISKIKEDRHRLIIIIFA